MKKRLFVLSFAVSVGLVSSVVAQDAVVPLAVGTVAPDFEIPGATQSGVLDESIKLSDYRGKTVVLAFYFRARSGG